MKSLHKFDRQETGKSAKKHAPSVSFSLSLAAVTIGLLSVLIPLGGGISYVFASDKKFDIDIDIDEDPIKRGDTQDITVTVKNDDTGKRVSNADVKLTVYPPDSDSTTATDETDDDGEAKFKVKIDEDAETGEYDVKVRVSKNGYDTKTVNTSFDVIKNHHDNNDDNDGDGNSSAAAASAASGSAASSAATARGSSAAAAAAASLHSAAAAAASG